MPKSRASYERPLVEIEVQFEVATNGLPSKARAVRRRSSSGLRKNSDVSLIVRLSGAPMDLVSADVVDSRNTIRGHTNLWNDPRDEKPREYQSLSPVPMLAAGEFQVRIFGREVPSAVAHPGAKELLVGEFPLIVDE